MHQQPCSSLIRALRCPRRRSLLCRTLLAFFLVGVCTQCTPTQQSEQTQAQPQPGSSVALEASPAETTKNTEVAAPAPLASPEDLLERFNLSVDRG